ncbi:MAG: hypothetical protein S4CHLAM2_04620 [Chlamydiales bacterium]|nr:hypothetical protein [Chlamydiales bacterium]
MLKYASLLLSLFALLSFPTFAEETSAQKHYCSAEQVELNDAVILVHLDRNLVEIDTLLVDQGGIYFNEDAVRCFYCRRPLNPKNTCECPTIR